MPRRGKRIKLARGIYKDKTGLAAVCCGKETRYPHGTPLQELRDWQDTIRKQRKGSGVAVSARGTLNHAIDELETLEGHLASWGSRRAELRAWGQRLGPRRRHTIDATDVRTLMSAWARAGVAPKTIRNRLWSLQHLYHMLDGPRADTPCDDIAPPAKVRRVINPTSPDVILRVYGTLLTFEQDGRLRDAKTRARFMVRATSGRRPVEIMRAEPDDLDLERRLWRVRDAKGGWSEGLYLDDDALIAWQTFITADAWGPFNTGSQAAVLRAAGWPSDRDDRGKYRSRPYNLRHSVGIALSERGHDLHDVAAWLGQKDARTARESYVPILKSRMQRMGESLAGRLGGWTVPS